MELEFRTPPIVGLNFRLEVEVRASLDSFDG
jgi:hypothetical protein